MEHQQQPALSVRTRIEPHRLHHHAFRRCQPPHCRLCLILHARTQRLRRKAGDIDTPQQRLRRHAAGGCDLQPAVLRRRRRHGPQPERVVIVDQRL